MNFWQEHLQQTPGLAPYLTVLARKFVQSGRAPRTLTLGPVPEDAQLRRALEFLLGRCREKNGKLAIALPERLRTPEALQALADTLGVAPAPTAPDGAGVIEKELLRQRLLHPELAGLLAGMRDWEDVRRLFRGRPDAAALLHGLLQAVAQLRVNAGAITLSQLGADALNDSKALRAGPPRRLLERMLATVAQMDEQAPGQVLARFGVIDNPYTTFALVYGPLVYVDAAARAWRWPLDLHAAGQAAALTWEQVQAMRAIRVEHAVAGVVTSENAAPFHRLVESRPPAVCVYTEGYPNAAVRRVLQLLAETGLTARHWGDSDLDGLRIAECVARVIPTELFVPSATARSRLRPLTADQRRRAEAFLAAHPDFRCRDRLEATLREGWLEQEQSQ